MELWGYQETAVQKLRDAIRDGYRDILLVSPTGSGKTVIASAVISAAAEKYNHSLFLAHRREIIHQTSEKLERFGCMHGIEMAGEVRSPFSPVSVGSIQTFTSRYVHGNRMMPRAELLFFDEAHRSLAPSYQTVRSMYPGSILIGLTATPCRGDGRGMGSMYSTMVESTTIQELIEQGFLVQPRMFAPSMPNLDGVGVRAGDYIRDDLEEVMDRQELVGNVVKDWQDRAGNRQTVVFASGVRHSLHLAQEFERAGVRVEHIDGKTPKRERDETLQKFAAGDIQVITNCDVLLEGWDCPPVSCAVLARPTKSYALYLQMAGRVLRAWEGKDDCIIIDHAGAVYRHGFVEDAGDWSLDPDEKIEDRKKRSNEEKEALVTCRECFTVYEAQPSCPKCGWTPTTQAREVNMAEGRLREVPRVVKKKDDRQKLWDDCLWRCIKTDRKVGVAAHMYRKKTGVWPSRLQCLPEGKTEWGMKAGDFYAYWKQGVGHTETT